MAQDDIQGQVVDAQGNPVSGAIVELTKSYQSSPTGQEAVQRTTTDSNGNYIFEGHPDGDGTTQEWHVSAYNHDGTAYVNSFNNPGVTAELPSNAIPDSAILHYPFGGRSGSTLVEQLDGQDGTANGLTNVSGNYYVGHAESGDGTDDHGELTTWGTFGSTYLTSDFGIAFTVEGANGSTEGFVGTRNGAAGNNPQRFELGWGNYANAGELEFHLRDGDSQDGDIAVNTDAAFNDGNKYRVFWRKTGNTASDVECYVNNTSESLTTVLDRGTFDNVSDFDNPLYTHAHYVDGSVSRFGDVTLDNLLVYDSPTISDIQADYDIQPWS